MSLFPLFLRLDGLQVLVVGGGPIAAGKLDGLLAAGAKVKVVAPEIRPELERAGVELHRRPFQESDLDGVWLVISAAPGAVNREVSKAAEARRIFVNAVDDPSCGTAYLAGTLNRGGVTIAVSTDGAAPALAGLLREGLEAVIPEEIEAWVSEARAQRERWKKEGLPMAERRPRLLQALVELYETRARRAAGESR
jgi:siroheme synthase-like protein